MPHIYSRYHRLLFLCALAGFLQGCKNITPTGQVPTYVHIDSFRFTPYSPVGIATSSHQISTIWVYYNDASVGVFDLPATFPVITNGKDSGTLEVTPGVTLDGLNDLLAADPFYQVATTTLVSQPGKIINYTPQTGYYPNVVYPISNFNYSNGFTLSGGTIPIIIDTADSLVFEGRGSGSIWLASPGDSSVDSVNIPLTIPAGNAFIEFNYKSSLPFYVGMQSNQAGISTTPYYLAGIYPSGTWQKFYLGITDYIAQYHSTTYNFFIKTSLPDSQAQGRLLLDNIQLLHF